MPTVATNYTNKIEYDGKNYTCEIWDTGGQAEFEHMRRVTYAETDVFIVCFDISDETSLENACEMWKKELENLGPKRCAKILCGTKGDLRKEKKCVETDLINEKVAENKFLHY